MTAQAVVDALKASGLRLTTAESCTGGLISGAVTEIPGSSAVFDRGFVTYSNAAKVQMLAVPAALIDQYGAVSEQVAEAMAQGALQAAGADIAIAVTGIAGPGGSEFKPEGRVCFGLALSGGKITSETVEFGAIGRASVRAATVNKALDIVLNAIS